MNEDFEKIKSYYNQLNSKRIKKLRISYIAVTLFLFAVLFVTYLKKIPLNVNFIEADIFRIIILIVIYLSLYLVFNFFIINFPSRNIFFKFLLPKIVEDINAIHNFSIKYEPFPKDKTYLRKGGLFPTVSTFINNYKLSFTSERGNNITIYDTFTASSNRRERAPFFNGFYYIFNYKSYYYFQLRNNLNPVLKGIKFKRLKNYNDFREFVQENMSHIDEKYYKIYIELMNKYPGLRIYMSGVLDEFHLAIWRDRLVIAKFKELTYEIYNSFKKELLEKIEFANEFEKILNDS